MAVSCGREADRRASVEFYPGFELNERGEEGDRGGDLKGIHIYIWLK